MKIDVSGIAKIDGASLNLKFEEKMDDLGDISEDFEFNSPVCFIGKIENHGGVLKLTGNLTTDYTTKCYRCLKELGTKMSVSISEDFFKEGHSEDIEAYTYQGNFIELDKVLKDNIILNLPVRQVCDEKCRGLCSVCGTNLNENNCSCREESVDSRMQILKSFFGN